MPSILDSISTAIQREARSFKAHPLAAGELASPPVVGSPAPTPDQLPISSTKPTLIAFLRHCGCPFAEKTFNDLVTAASKHPEIRCIAVSQSSREATEKWIIDIGGQWDIQVVVDEERALYAAWGLGTSSTWYLMNPWSLASSINLARTDGIWTRGTESGSRWQTGGAFAVDVHGILRWSHIPRTADDRPRYDKALQALELR